MIKTAVIGAGYLGIIHAKIYSRLKNSKIVAICDMDQSKEKLAKELGVEFFTDYKQIKNVDAVSIVTPTPEHHDVGLFFLQQNIPCLIEKPLAATVEQGKKLCEAGKNTILQVGHIEQFNPAIREARQYITEPWFFNAIRTSPYPFRSTDVSVVFDLMIHDIYLAISLIGEMPYKIYAEGSSVFSTSEDVANARLEFPCGCTANLMASRISAEKKRTIQIFQKNNHLSLDLLNGNGIYFNKSKDYSTATQHNELMDKFILSNDGVGSLDAELMNFIENVEKNIKPVIDGEAGLNALCVAESILNTIN